MHRASASAASCPLSPRSAYPVTTQTVPVRVLSARPELGSVVRYADGHADSLLLRLGDLIVVDRHAPSGSYARLLAYQTAFVH